MSAQSVTVTIDRHKVALTPGLVHGLDLITLAGITLPSQLLLDISGDVDVPIAPADAILIRGGEKFSIGDGAPPTEDNPCLRHPVHIYFNNNQLPHDELFTRAKVTGAELKQLDPNLRPGDILVADLEGLADETIPDDLRLVIQPKDRFITVPCGNVGYGDLLSKQVEAVQTIYPDAFLKEEAGNRYLVVGGFPVPPHFCPTEATLLVILPNGFPMAAPDMFWVEPHLRLANGGEPEGSNQYEQYLGRTWQRFSWHYTHGDAVWRVGHSSLLTHLQFCQARLAQAK